MGHVAWRFPRPAGSITMPILGGKGWGWATAWFNLIGLVTALTGINVGMYLFLRGPLGFASANSANPTLAEELQQDLVVAGITASQAILNHYGVRLTTRLTDFAGYWILFVSVVLTIAALVCAERIDLMRLVTIENYSGSAGGDVWELTDNLARLFALGFLPPGYMIMGFDASRACGGGDGGGGAACAQRDRPLRARLRHLRLDHAVGLDRGHPQSGSRRFQGRSGFRCDHGRSLSALAGHRALPWHRRGDVPVRPGDADLDLAHRLLLRARRRTPLLRLASASQQRLSHAAVFDLDGGPRIGPLRGLFLRLCYHHQRLHDLPVRVVRHPDRPGSFRLWPKLDADGTVEPGRVVSAAGGVVRGGGPPAARLPHGPQPTKMGRRPGSWGAPRRHCWLPGSRGCAGAFGDRRGEIESSRERS